MSELASSKLITAYCLDISAVIREGADKNSSGVCIVIKPADLLSQHRFEREVAYPSSQILTRHTETQRL